MCVCLCVYVSFCSNEHEQFRPLRSHSSIVQSFGNETSAVIIARDFCSSYCLIVLYRISSRLTSVRFDFICQHWHFLYSYSFFSRLTELRTTQNVTFPSSQASNKFELTLTLDGKSTVMKSDNNMLAVWAQQHQNAARHFGRLISYGI